MFGRKKEYRYKEIRIGTAFEFDHPIIGFLFVRPAIWLGRVWYSRILLPKSHWYGAVSFAPVRRSCLHLHRGPEGELQYHPNPWVYVGHEERRYIREHAGDMELSKDAPN